MHPKIKNRPVGTKKPAANTVKPLLLHDVGKLTASANAASRRRITAKLPASGPANHARHHASPKSQG